MDQRTILEIVGILATGAVGAGSVYWKMKTSQTEERSTHIVETEKVIALKDEIIKMREERIDELLTQLREAETALAEARLHFEREVASLRQEIGSMQLAHNKALARISESFAAGELCVNAANCNNRKKPKLEDDNE